MMSGTNPKRIISPSMKRLYFVNQTKLCDSMPIKCNTCNTIRDRKDFYINKTYKCKSCLSTENKKKYSLNKDKHKIYYEKNKEKIKVYYEENKEKIIKKIHSWKKRNKDKVRKYKIKETLKRTKPVKSKPLW